MKPIWKGAPTPINKEAKELILSYLEKKEEGVYANEVVVDLGVTFEYAYRLMKNPNAKKPNFNEALMSIEAQDWAGLSVRDPLIDLVIIKRGGLAGALHTWSTALSFSSEDALRDRAIESVKRMPEL